MDFEVVAPPGANTNHGPPSSHEQGHHQWSFPTGNGLDSTTTTTTTTPATNQSDFSVITDNNQKPSIDQIDGPGKPDPLGSRPTGGNQLNLSANQRQQQQHQADVDANQLDSKQTIKDYRSSGGQQTTTTTVATNELQSDDSSSSSSSIRQHDSSSASTTLLFQNGSFNLLLQLVVVVVVVASTVTSNVVRLTDHHEHARRLPLIAH